MAETKPSRTIEQRLDRIEENQQIMLRDLKQIRASLATLWKRLNLRDVPEDQAGFPGTDER
jgi:hypothetical protein